MIYEIVRKVAELEDRDFNKAKVLGFSTFDEYAQTLGRVLAIKATYPDSDVADKYVELFAPWVISGNTGFSITTTIDQSGKATEVRKSCCGGGAER